MSKPHIFIGAPFDFKKKCLIYPPTVRQVIENLDKYQRYLRILTVTQEDLWDQFKDKVDEHGAPIKAPTPLEFVLINSSYSKEFMQLLNDAFKFFTKESIRVIVPEKSILFVTGIENVKNAQELRLISEEDYFDFQNAIRVSVGSKKVERPPVGEDPRVSRIKAKARERDRIKAQKGMGITLETSMASLCCMGIGINPLNIGEISYACIETLITRYQNKEKYESDVASLLAGADSKKVKPKYWIRNPDD